jgi:uncharacterized protein YfdQ (DUF2303 family)
MTDIKSEFFFMKFNAALSQVNILQAKENILPCSFHLTDSGYQGGLVRPILRLIWCLTIKEPSTALRSSEKYSFTMI